jgi:hypothetical protein
MTVMVGFRDKRFGIRGRRRGRNRERERERKSEREREREREIVRGAYHTSETRASLRHQSCSATRSEEAKTCAVRQADAGHMECLEEHLRPPLTVLVFGDHALT